VNARTVAALAAAVAIAAEATRRRDGGYRRTLRAIRDADRADVRQQRDGERFRAHERCVLAGLDWTPDDAGEGS
jgi:hypothetical protein